VLFLKNNGYLFITFCFHEVIAIYWVGMISYID